MIRANSHAAPHRLHRPGARPAAVPGRWAAVLLVAAVFAVGPATAAVGRQAETAPTPLGQEATAGPLRLSVGQVLAGPEAVAAVVAVTPTNDPPREGIGYILVEIRAENAGDRPLRLDDGDFAVVGDAGLPHRFLDVEPPAPAIGGPLAPGESRVGWAVFAAPIDETGLTLRYDSLSLPGAWAEARLALRQDAPPPPAAPAIAPNQVGVDLAAPATLGEPIATADWEIVLLDVVTGAEVFPLVDYRTQALGENDAIGNDTDQSVWVALRLRVTALGDEPSPIFLPANAFAVVDAAGQPLPDLITLTPPRPEAAGPYEPGATQEAWVAFDVPAAADAAAVRFLPYAHLAANPDPRYLTFG